MTIYGRINETAEFDAQDAAFHQSKMGICFPAFALEQKGGLGRHRVASDEWWIQALP